MNPLEVHFQTLGFSDKEQLVYLDLAEAGRSPASIVSKRTKIPRATVYTILESLADKGVISQEQSSGTSMFLVSDLSSMQGLVAREKAQLEKKQESAEKLVELLPPFLKDSEYSVPKFLFFEGRKSIQSMLYQYLPKWRESMARVNDNTQWGYQDPTIVESYRGWHDHLWETIAEDEKICLFSHNPGLEKVDAEKILHREVRTLPKEISFASSIWLYGEYIVMIMSRQKPHYAFQMKDPVFAANLRAIFQLLWSYGGEERIA